MSVRTCDYCGGPLTVVVTREQFRRPFTPEGLAVVQRERLCKRGPKDNGNGCGSRTWAEEYVVASVPPLIESES